MSDEYYPVMPSPVIMDTYGDRYIGYEVLVDDVDLENFADEMPRLSREIRTILWEYNINPVIIYPSLPRNNKILILLVFEKTEVSEEKLNIIRKKILKIHKVVSVVKSKRYANIIYSDKMYYFNLLNYRWILVGPAFMRSIVKEIRDVIGNNVTDILLLTLGKAIGEMVYDSYLSLGGFKRMQDVIGFLEMLLSISGWGKLAETFIEKDRVILNILNLWECDVIYENNIEATPQLFKGILSGFFSRIFNKDINVNYMGTHRKNGELYCMFEVPR